MKVTGTQQITSGVVNVCQPRNGTTTTTTTTAPTIQKNKINRENCSLFKVSNKIMTKNKYYFNMLALKNCW